MKVKYFKVKSHCHSTAEYRGAVHSICNLKYSVAEKIPRVFHNGLNYDYRFIIKVLANKFNKRILKIIYLFRGKY